MNERDRLVLRARQLLDDPTLSQNQRIPNAAVLLGTLAASTRGTALREAVLSEIDDPDVRDQMRRALASADVV